MPTKRKQLTVADFPPEFMSIWQLAVDGKLSIEMDNAGSARNLIQRLYIFRKRLMEEAPSIAQPFYLVDLRVHDENGNLVSKATSVPAKAIIKTYVPTWKSQVASMISQVPERELNSPSELPVAQVPVPTGDALSGTLEMLGFGTGEKK